jgi:hypothetical protein
MGYLIFGAFGWEVMEPVTYMVSTFYAMVGSFFFLRYRRDFEMGSAKEMFTERKYLELTKKEGYDTEKVEFLRNYIAELKEQIGVLSNTEDDAESKFK